MSKFGKKSSKKRRRDGIKTKETQQCYREIISSRVRNNKGC